MNGSELLKRLLRDGLELTFVESRFSGEIEEGWDGGAEDIGV